MSNEESLKAETIVDKIEPEEATNLDELLRAIGTPADTKYLVVTDGSGSTRNRPGGTGAIIIRLVDRKVLRVGAAVTNTTSQEAEVRAVFEALNYLVTGGAGNEYGGSHVMIITDSMYTHQQLSKIASDPLAAMNFNKHVAFLAGIQSAARVGVTFESVHIDRNVNPLMVFADKMSKMMRKSVPETEIEALLNNEVLDEEDKFSLHRQTAEVKS